jgi:hypothetical protein
MKTLVTRSEFCIICGWIETKGRLHINLCVRRRREIYLVWICANLFHKGRSNDFNFSIAHFPYLQVCNNIPASPAYGVYILQLIWYARACSTYDQFLFRGNLLTDKLMSQGFQLHRLQAAFCKFDGRYNDLICPYNLSVCHMLSDMFHTNR